MSSYHKHEYQIYVYKPAKVVQYIFRQSGCEFDHPTYFHILLFFVQFLLKILLRVFLYLDSSLHLALLSILNQGIL